MGRIERGETKTGRGKGRDSWCNEKKNVKMESME